MLTCFAFSFFQVKTQVIVVKHHFTYSETDHVNCEAQDCAIVYPVFYFKNGQPLTSVNDSVRKILFDKLPYSLDGYNNSLFTGIIANGIDTSIINEDTLTVYNCGWIELRPDESNVDYEICRNEKQLLSFAISWSFDAGAGGNGGGYYAYTFNYDLKNNCWLNLKTLFPDNSDTLIIQKADSLFLKENSVDNIDIDNRFTGNVEINKGKLIFYYRQRFGGKSIDQSVVLNYVDYKKWLNPKYRKLLQP
jgi:hypothetical protein